MFAQFEAVCAKRVGDNQLCTRFDILAVDLSHCRRMREIELIKALVKADATRVEHGSHCAIDEES